MVTVSPTFPGRRGGTSPQECSMNNFQKGISRFKHYLFEFIQLHQMQILFLSKKLFKFNKFTSGIEIALCSRNHRVYKMSVCLLCSLLLDTKGGIWGDVERKRQFKSRFFIFNSEAKKPILRKWTWIVFGNNSNLVIGKIQFFVSYK